MSMTRNHGLDALRGWMLVSMTLTHLPTALSRWAAQPFGFVSNAEGFVFLSAYLVGRIYSCNAQNGMKAIGAPVWRRAFKIYTYHLATLAFAFTVAAAIAVYARRPALANLLGFYLSDPRHALLDAALLVYRPPLLDILPMYVLFMIVTPGLLASGARRGWMGIFSASLIIWLAAQFGVRVMIHDFFNVISPWQFPSIRHLGAFNIYAWQLLWISGIWLGQRHVRDPQLVQRIPLSVAHGALILASAFLALRYTLGSYPSHAPAWLLSSISKWNLGAVRMLDFVSLGIVCIRFGEMVKRWIPTQPLELLGRASLPVFSAHVVICLLVLGLIRDDAHRLTGTMQAIVLVATFTLLFAVAIFDQRRRAPKVKALPQPGQA